MPEHRKQTSFVLLMCDDLRARLRAFMASCRESHHGADYRGPFTPVNAFQEITGKWAEDDFQ
jgi:hypothetical protein